MFTEFQIIQSDNKYVILYKKWYHRKWRMLGYKNDSYLFDNKESAAYMVKSLKEAGL